MLNAGPIAGPRRDPWQPYDQPVEQQSSFLTAYGMNGKQAVSDYGMNGKQTASDPRDYQSPHRDFGGFNSTPWFGSPSVRASVPNSGYTQPAIIIFVFAPPTTGATSNLRSPGSNQVADATSRGSSEVSPQRFAPPAEIPISLMPANAVNDPGSRAPTARSLPAVVLNSAAVTPVRPVTLATPTANPLITGSAAPVHVSANVALADPFEGLNDSGVYSNLAIDIKVLAAQVAAEGNQVSAASDVEESEIASTDTSIIASPASKVLLAEIPFNLHGLEQAVQTVMGQVQRLGTEFTEWLEENQLTTAATVIAAAAAGSGAVFYLRRRAARAADRRDEEASSNWLFVQLQTAPSRD